jgi:hypothetical protein
MDDRAVVMTGFPAVMTAGTARLAASASAERRRAGVRSIIISPPIG